MHIDIERLNEQELLDLHHRIVARLKFLKEARAHTAMVEFSIGERVSFTPPDRQPLFGILIRYNRKTVSVLTDNGVQWNVAPQMLRRVLPSMR
ncbi:MAG: hypothetical protein NC924_04975 [Candidatus Omnitrophica bacterium]|nr:hypothetical protein [Candidatus Omnitrophota bacterium]